MNLLQSKAAPTELQDVSPYSALSRLDHAYAACSSVCSVSVSRASITLAWWIYHTESLASTSRQRLDGQLNYTNTPEMNSTLISGP